MDNRLPPELGRFFVDKKPLQERVARQNAERGIASTPL